MNRKERRGAAKRAPGGVASDVGQFAALFAQAVRQYQLGDHVSAEATCRALLSQNAKDVGSLNLLGVIAHQGGRYEEAAACFRSLVSVAPAMAMAHQSLGGALAAAGRFEEAIPAFEKAVALAPRESGGPVPDAAEGLLALGNLYARLNRTEEAAKRFERALALRPDYAQVYNDFGAVLLAAGKPKEAAGQFAKALQLAPEILENFAAVVALLAALNPSLGEGLARASAAWPALLPAQELLGPAGLGAIADDVLLRCVLEFATVRSIELERFLTSVRAALLKAAAEETTGGADAGILQLGCALARQCFINEYVFANTSDEMQQAETLKRRLVEVLAKNEAVEPLWCAAVALYFPLMSLPDPQLLLDRSWPQPVEELLKQQIREVQEEQRLRDSIPRLTAIEDEASLRVRQQYEENPYPRWVLPAASRGPVLRSRVTIDQHLQSLFPLAPLRPLGDRNGVDIMVAGSGTGQHPIGMARQLKDVRMLAIDLSLNSLCYAKRKTQELGLQSIDYAQADILHLDSLDRSFDVIDAGGVLHHMTDPAEGWRKLLTLLRPGGFMRVGLYSELGRADIVAARRFIAERGFGSTPEDIRRCRQEMLGSPLQTIARYGDFFSISECRDMLFHVQEQRLTIPQIKQFLAAHGLQFIGFEVDAETAAVYRARFADDPTMTDLDRWHAFETGRPATFAAMYKFWCQR